MALACFVGVGSAQAAYIDSRAAIQPTVGSDLRPAPTSYFPRSDLNNATLSDSVSLPLQDFSWSGVSYIDSAYTGQYTSSIASRSEMGNLGAYAKTVSSAENGAYVRGSAQATAYFRDTFIIHAPPGNSTATLNFRLDVHGVGTATATSLATYSAKLYISDATTYPVTLDANSYMGEHVVLDQAATLYVGWQYTIVGELQANAITNLSDPSPYASAEMDAFNTSHSYIWSGDPGVYIETTSGASYSVPEPTSLASLILGVALLLRRRP
jgi:hypothetical protein